MSIPTLQQQIAAVAAANEALPTASTGQVAQDDAAPTTTSNPSLQQQIADVNTAYQSSQGNNNGPYVGTNSVQGDTLSLTNSQATPPVDLSKIEITATSQQIYTADQVNKLAGVAPQNPGVGAPRDDNPAPTTNSTQQAINNSFSGKVVPQPNVLDNYVSYTYGLCLYVLTPDQFTAFTKGSRNVATWSLLAQTGGANQVGRNQFFQPDYYMDNLVIETWTPGKGSGMSHSASKIDFTITEPNGITLINNLHAAVSTLYKQAGVTDTAAYLQATYMMVIKFYGYNENGQLVYPIKGQELVGYPNISSNPAVVEKYYPFLIENLTFKLVNKQIEYQIAGKPVAYQTSLSYDRGSIPFQFELVGETVSDILVGKPVGTVQTTDPGSRTSSPQPQTTAPQADSAQTAALFNDGTGYAPGYDPNAGWSA